MGQRKNPSRPDKINYGGVWAKTMAKWLITYSMNYKTSKKVRWKIVSFEGPKGRESRGIVDLMAIRKDHKCSKEGLKKGDLFEIILLQVKGGSSPDPNKEDIIRLKRVAKFYHAKNTVLVHWKKGKAPIFRILNRKPSDWEVKNVIDIFK